MNSVDFFLLAHAMSHSGELVGADDDAYFYEDRAIRQLNEDHLRLRPQGLNSIAWIIWHIARTEDFAANVLIASRPQVLDEKDWPGRLKVSRRDIGTGMTSDEVSKLSATIDIPSVRAYRLAVGRRTREIAQTLPSGQWAIKIDASRIRRVVSEGVFRPEAPWLDSWFGGRPLAWVLSWQCLGHSNMHLGQAIWVRKLVLMTTSSQQ